MVSPSSTLQVESPQNGIVRLVGEVHGIELDGAPQGMFLHGPRLILDLRQGVNQGEDPLRRGHRLLQLGIDAGHFLNGKQHPEDVLDEGLNAAQGDHSGLELETAHLDDQGHSHRRQDLHHRQKGGRQPGRPETGAVHARGQLGELLQVGDLAPQRLRDPDPVDALRIAARDAGVQPPHIAPVAENVFLEQQGGAHHDRDDGQHDQGQAPADGGHEAQEDQDGHRSPEHVQEPEGHQFGHPPRVGRGAGHDPADRRAVVVGEGQFLQAAEHGLAQVVVHGLAHGPGAEYEQRHTAGEQHGHPRPQPQQGLHLSQVAGQDSLVQNALAEVDVRALGQHHANHAHQVSGQVPAVVEREPEQAQQRRSAEGGAVLLFLVLVIVGCHDAVPNRPPQAGGASSVA